MYLNTMDIPDGATAVAEPPAQPATMQPAVPLPAPTAPALPATPAQPPAQETPAAAEKSAPAQSSGVFDVPELSDADRELTEQLNTIVEFQLLGAKQLGSVGHGDWLLCEWRDSGYQVHVHVPTGQARDIKSGNTLTLFEFAATFCGFLNADCARRAYREKLKLIGEGKTAEEAHRIVMPDAAQPEAAVSEKETEVLKCAICQNRNCAPESSLCQQCANEAAKVGDRNRTQANEPTPTDLPGPFTITEGGDPGSDYIVRVRVAREAERKARRTYDIARLEWEEAVQHLGEVIDFDDSPETAPTEEEREQLAEDAEVKPLSDVTMAELNLPAGIVKSLGTAGIATCGQLTKTAGGAMEKWQELLKLTGIGKAKAETIRDGYLSFVQQRHAGMGLVGEE